jgi:hypothetical protein
MVGLVRGLAATAQHVHHHLGVGPLLRPDLL